MAGNVYHINKGINQPLMFQGLKAQYITYLAIGLVVLLLLFSCMYLAGLSLLWCSATILLLGGSLFAGVYRLSGTYGEHGLLKKLARRHIPPCIRIKSRKTFTTLSPEPITTKEDSHDTSH